MRLKIKKRYKYIYNIIAIFSYKITLDLAYYFIISRVWLYDKFVLNLNNLKLIESYFLLFVIFVLMPKSPKKLSNIVIWLLVLISYIPILTLFGLMNQSRMYVYAITGFWILVFFLYQTPDIFVLPLRKMQSKLLRNSIFVCLSVVVFFLIYKYIGFFINFNLAKVYDIRSDFINTNIPLAGYLFTWLAYVVNPIFFALFLNKKKWLPFILVIFLQILIFSVTGMKSFLFALPFVLGLALVIKQRRPFFLITIIVIAIILCGMLSYWLMDDVWISSLTTRRSLLVPAQLSFFYHDFFSKNPYTFLSQHHIFKNFINYPYELNPPHLIAKTYFNRPQMGANNGIYADAYMNFGLVGLVFWGIFLVIILKLINAFSKNKNIKMTIATIAMPIMFLTNSALLTCLVTHGLILSLILLYLLPKEKLNIQYE